MHRVAVLVCVGGLQQYTFVADRADENRCCVGGIRQWPNSYGTSAFRRVCQRRSVWGSCITPGSLQTVLPKENRHVFLPLWGGKGSHVSADLELGNIVPSVFALVLALKLVPAIKPHYPTDIPLAAQPDRRRISTVLCESKMCERCA